MPHTKEQTRYYRTYTPKGRAISVWSDVKTRSGNKDGKNLAYTNVKLLITKEEFFGWAVPALEKWIAEGRPMTGKERPALDRINDGNYELGNLQFITQAENNKKKACSYNSHAPINQAWCSGCKVYLPSSNFNKHKKRSNGLQPYCKTCRKNHNSQKVS